MNKVKIQNWGGEKNILINKDITASELLGFARKLETELANLTEYLPRAKVSASDEVIYLDVEISNREFDMLGVVQYCGEDEGDCNYFKMYLVNSGPACCELKVETWNQIIEKIDDFIKEIILGGIPFV